MISIKFLSLVADGEVQTPRISRASRGHTDSSCPMSSPPLELSPQTKAAILWNQKLHTHNLMSTFKFAFQDTQLRKYIQNKTKWSDSIMNSISWPFVRGALFRTPSILQKKAHIKFSNRLLATDAIKNQRNKSHDHRCTRCHSPHEDWEHTFQCRKLDKNFLQNNVSTLRSNLNHLSVSKPMILLLLHGIDLWQRDLPIVFPASQLTHIAHNKHSQLLFTAFNDCTPRNQSIFRAAAQKFDEMEPFCNSFKTLPVPSCAHFHGNIFIQII